jgi:hypothetical protein
VVKTISASGAREGFGDLLGAIDATKEPIVVERDCNRSRPQAGA